MATTLVRSLPRTEAPRLTGVTGNTNLLGDVPWGPAAPQIASSFDEWQDLNGDAWSGMTDLQKDNWLRAYVYFNLGGRYLSSTRVLELDSQGKPTGKKSTLDLSSATVSATNAEIESGVGTFTLVSSTTIQFIIDGGTNTFTANIGPLQVSTDIIFVSAVTAGEFQNYVVIDVDGTIGDVAVDVGQFNPTMTRSNLETEFDSTMIAAGHLSTLSDGTGAGDVLLNVDDPSVAFTYRSLTTSSELAAALPVGVGRCAQYDTGAATYDLAVGAETSVTVTWVYNVNGFTESLPLDLVQGTDAVDLDAVTSAELFTALTAAVSTVAGLSALNNADDIRLVADAQKQGVVPSVAREVHAVAQINTAFTAETITAGQASLVGTQVRDGVRTAVQVQSELEASLGMGALATISSAGNRLTVRRVASGSTKTLRVDGTAREALGFSQFTVAGTDSITAQVIWTASGTWVGAFGNEIGLKVVAGSSADRVSIELYLHGTLKTTLVDVQDTEESLEDKSDDQNYITLARVNAGVPVVGSVVVSMAGGTDRLAPSSTLGPNSYLGDRVAGTGVWQANKLSIDDMPDMLVMGDWYGDSDTTSDAGLVHTGIGAYIDHADTKERVLWIPSMDPTQDYRRTIEVADANATYVSSDNIPITHGGFKLFNPDRKVTSPFGGGRLLTIDGAIVQAALTSRGDGALVSGGIHKAAAGTQRNGRGVAGFPLVSIWRSDDDTQADTANPAVTTLLDAKNINYFVNEGQIVLESARIFSTIGNYRTVPNRRGHSNMFRAMEKALKSLESREIIDEIVANEGKDLIEEILRTNMRIGAFSSTSESLAFAVESLSTAADFRNGHLNYRVFTSPVGIVERIETLVSNKA